MSVRQFVERAAIKQLREQGIPVPASLGESEAKQLIGELRKKAEPYGIAFQATDTVLDVFYNYVNDLLKKIPRQYRLVIPIGYALAVFLAVRAIAIVFRWVAALVVYLLFELALLTGIATTTLEATNREIIVLR